jgi:cysteine synthase A
MTDTMDLYQTRVEELRRSFGLHTETDGAGDYHRHLTGQLTDHMLELRCPERKRIHNLKYFTWVEQQGESVQTLDRQWYDYPDFWEGIHSQCSEIDSLIGHFNSRSGVLARF